MRIMTKVIVFAIVLVVILCIAWIAIFALVPKENRAAVAKSWFRHLCLHVIGKIVEIVSKKP